MKISFLLLITSDCELKMVDWHLDRVWMMSLDRAGIEGGIKSSDAHNVGFHCMYYLP